MSLDVRLVPFTTSSMAAARAESVLTAEERIRARQGTPSVYVRRVLLRAALRELLAVHLGVAPEAVPLRRTPTGRPHLASGGIDVSCSAGDDLGVVALARGARVGVDVEPVRPWSADVLAEGWLSPAECAALAEVPAQDRAEAATVSWTQKEAVLKGRGTGLTGGLATVETRIGCRQAVIAGWSVRPVAVPDGHVASVALQNDRALHPFGAPWTPEEDRDDYR